MNKPFLSQIEPHMARPFVNDYCDRWNIPYDKDVDYTYGNAVLWMGSFYRNALRAVCGLLVSDSLPDELFIYGFYGDGSQYQALPIRALIDIIEKMPYNYKYGYIVSDNAPMLKTMRKFGWDVIEEGLMPDGRECVKAGIRGTSTRGE
jgi:hypothetical protein